MPISGLVLTLSDNPTRRREVIEELARMPGVLVGELHGRWLSVVTAADSDEQSMILHESLLRRSGIVYADVVQVGFDESKAGICSELPV
jgi:hypothetical protein